MDANLGLWHRVCFLLNLVKIVNLVKTDTSHIKVAVPFGAATFSLLVRHGSGL